MYHHMSVICLSLHMIGIILDHNLHWIYPYEKQTQNNQLYLFFERKYELILVTIIRRQNYGFFTHTLKRDILNKLCGQTMQLEFETTLLNILVYLPNYIYPLSMQGFLTQTPKSTRIKAFNNAAGERQEMKKRHYIE